VRFHQAARERGITPIIGAEITLDSGYHLTLLVKDDTGYANLSELLSRAQLENKKGDAKVTAEMLALHRDGLIALSGCRYGELPSLLLADDTLPAQLAASRYQELFGHDNFYLELQHHNLPVQDAAVRAVGNTRPSPSYPLRGDQQRALLPLPMAVG